VRKGIVIGKFLPLHKGHTALIDFALKHCNELIILIEASDNDSIPGRLRYQWLSEIYEIKRVHIEYTGAVIPDLKDSAKIWADYLSEKYPDLNIIFSSNESGKELARYLNIEYICFDKERKQINISSSDLRKNPYKYWFFLPEAVRPFYVKKVCIYGYGTHGKSDLTEKLAGYYETEFVHKMVHDIIGEKNIKYEDISKIAQAHASEILQKQKTANKVLFCDTDFITAKIFSSHYFKKEPNFPEWVEKANNYDLYLFYEADISNPARTDRASELMHEHKKWFFSGMEKDGINYFLINGSLDEMFIKSCNAVNQLI
jgi:HTH-type transcriptional regulator, transcriptional repressor of NAD biosynthesis genes